MEQRPQNMPGRAPRQQTAPPQRSRPPMQGGQPPRQGRPPVQGNQPPRQGRPPMQGGQPPRQGRPPVQGGQPPRQGRPPMQGGQPPRQGRPPMQGGQPPRQGRPPMQGGQPARQGYPPAQGGQRPKRPAGGQPPRRGKAPQHTGRGGAPGKRRPVRPLTPEEHRRRRLRRSIITAVVATGTLLLAVFISTRLLFKIETIEIRSTQGELAYSNEQIIQASGVAEGDSLFGFDPARSALSIQETLPYLENVSVERHLPNKILIAASPAQEESVVESDSGWVVLSKNCKILRLDANPPEGLVQVVGASAASPVPGQALQLSEADKLPILQALLTGTEKQGLVPINEINLTDTLEITLLYQGRIRIVLGTEHDLAYKLDWAWRMVTPGQTDDSLGENEQGTLDVSTRGEDGFGRARWRAGVL